MIFLYKKYLILFFILLWSILLLILEIVGYGTYVELISIIIGMLMTAIISYDSFTNSNGTTIYRLITGLIEIILGFLFIGFSFSLIHSAIILLIGGQLIGISLALSSKKPKSSYLSSSTQRPETIDPEPSPEPRPF
jgi:hypothetical protein